MIDLRTKGRLQFVMVGIIFAGPMFIAYLIYNSDSDWLRSSGTENGQLLDTQQLLPDTVLTPGSDTDGPRFRGKWSLIIVGDGPCAAACEDALLQTRQVHRALGRDEGRVQRVLVDYSGAPDFAFLEREHPTLLVLEPGSDLGRELFALLGEHVAGDVYLADPVGNLVMRFPRGTGMRGIHEDLKHLLKISRIG